MSNPSQSQDEWDNAFDGLTKPKSQRATDPTAQPSAPAKSAPPLNPPNPPPTAAPPTPSQRARVTVQPAPQPQSRPQPQPQPAIPAAQTIEAQIHSTVERIPRGHKLSSPAAVVALLCFFLPWVFVSCGNQTVGSYAGSELAIGPTVRMGYTAQRIDGWPQLFIVPLAAIGAVALAFLACKRGRLTVLDGIGLAGFGIAPLLVLLFTYIPVQGQAAREGIRFDPQIGLWGVLLGFVCVIAGAALNHLDARRQGG